RRSRARSSARCSTSRRSGSSGSRRRSRRRLLLLAASVPTISWEEALLRLVLAGVLGAAVGLERELREREAGLRTHLLVSLGACLFTLASAYGFHDFFAQSGALVRS